MRVDLVNFGSEKVYCADKGADERYQPVDPFGVACGDGGKPPCEEHLSEVWVPLSCVAQLMVDLGAQGVVGHAESVPLDSVSN